MRDHGGIDEHHGGLVVLGRKIADLPPFRTRLPWRGGDLQTLHNTIMRPRPDFSPYPEERLYLPMRDGSGDSLWALVNWPAATPHKIPVMLIHGLTGCETSRNIMVSAAYYLSQGHPVIRLNLRSAGPSLGKCKEFYHAGRSADVRDAIAALPGRLKDEGLYLVGVSLGGNVLLKFLAEGDGIESVRGAAAVCAPIDLKAAQERIMAPRNAVYHWHLLRSMKTDALRWTGESGDKTHRLLPKINSVYAFDDQIVAPQNGFAGADDYYRRSSAGPVLNEIRTPTLLLHPRTDPWVPATSYLKRTWTENGTLTVVMPPDGGHVGFHGSGGRVPWHNVCIRAFFEDSV